MTNLNRILFILFNIKIIVDKLSFITKINIIYIKGQIQYTIEAYFLSQIITSF
jgi:hypothetical protein